MSVCKDIGECDVKHGDIVYYNHFVEHATTMPWRTVRNTMRSCELSSSYAHFIYLLLYENIVLFLFVEATCALKQMRMKVKQYFPIYCVD